MPDVKTGTLKIRDAHIMWRNFSGSPTKFNQKGGIRSFHIRLDDAEMAEQMRDQGWNVRMYQPEEGDPMYHLQVFVRFDIFPPEIYVYANGNRTEMTEDTIDALDQADIERCDITIRGYRWEVNGNIGVKAYVKRMRIRLEEDEWAEEWDNAAAELEHPTDDLEEDLPF